MKKITSLSRAKIANGLVLLALIASLFAIFPGVVDLYGALRVAVVLILLLLAFVVRGREVLQNYRLNQFFISLALFFVFVLISIYTARNTGFAFWGNLDAFVISGTLCIAGVLLASSTRDLLDARWFLRLPIVLVALISVHQVIFLVRTFFPLLPFPAEGLLSFSSNTPTQIALLSVVAVLISAGAFMWASLSLRARLLWLFPLLLNVFVLIRIDRPWAWVTLTIGLVILLVNILRNYESVQRAATHVIFVLTAVSLVLSFVRIPLPLKITLPQEFALKQTTSAKIILNAFSDKPARTFFGFGPASFPALYTQYRPKEINYTSYWNIRFQAPASTLLLSVAELGVLSTFAVLVFLGLVLRCAWREISDKSSGRGIRKAISKRIHKDADLAPLHAGMFSAFVALLFSALVSILSIPALIFIFLIAGWFFGICKKEKQKKQKMLGGSARLLGGWLTILCVLGILVLIVLSVRLYIAERAYESGIRAFQENRLSDADQEYHKAEGIISKEGRYHILGARIALAMHEQTTATSDEVEQLLNESVLRAGKAVAASPYDLRTYETAIIVGSSVLSAGISVPEMEKWLESATSLDPNSPAWDLMSGEMNEYQGNLPKAETAYRAALSKMSNFAPAIVRLAALLETTGRTDEAISLMEGLVKDNRADVVGFDLFATLLERRGADGDLDAAENILTNLAESLVDEPQPMIRLAELLERREKFKEARSWYEAALRFYPNNTNLQQRIQVIDNLTATTSTPSE